MHKIRIGRTCCMMVLVIVLCTIAKPVSADAESWVTTIGTTGFQKQERPNWCWVASARNMAVTKVSSVNVTKSQSDVVKSIKGNVNDCTGSLQETSKATKLFNVSCKSYYKSSRLALKTIKGKIDNGGGVIMAMQNALYGGHAILLYGYSSNNNVKIYDPKQGMIV